MRVRAVQLTDEARLREIVAVSEEAARFVDGPAGLVAEDEAGLHGFVLYRVVAGEGEILNLAVDPVARRRGVGRALLEAMLPEAGEWFLEVRVSNARAIGLYEGLGFIEVGRRPKYYSDGEDALLLRWRS